MSEQFVAVSTVVGDWTNPRQKGEWLWSGARVELEGLPGVVWANVYVKAEAGLEALAEAIEAAVEAINHGDKCVALETDEDGEVTKASFIVAKRVAAGEVSFNKESFLASEVKEVRE